MVNYNFVKCARAYQKFLKKFSKNPSFDNLSIIAALTHVYNEVFDRKGPLPIHSKYNLTRNILLNEQKILDDLEVLKCNPKSVFQPLASNVTFLKIKKLVSEILSGYDQYDDEQLINLVFKKFKSCSKTEYTKKLIVRLKVCI